MKQLVLTLPALSLPATGLAAPDFSRTTITADPAQPREGDVVTFTIAVRNSGNQDAPNTQVVLMLPGEGMYIGVAGFDGATYARDERTIRGSLAVPAGGEQRFTFRILTARDSGGHVLSPTVKVSNLYLQATDQYIHGETAIETRIGSGGVQIGGFRIAPAGLALILVLALYPLLRVVVGRRAGHGPIVAIVIAVGFLTLFAAMAQRDWQSLSSWHETSCTILDSRLRLDTSSSTRRDTGSTRRTTSSETTTYQPLLGLEYVADGKPMVSSGFDTGSRLAIGGFGGAIEEFSRWPVGETVPCWFDPAHPEDVVVIRGFGGAYLFALVPLPLLAYGVWAGRAGRAGKGR